MPGIGVARFDVRDVVRHPLVARIVDAYDQRAKARRDAGMTEAGPQTGAGAGSETGPPRGRRRTGAQNGASEGTSESDGPGQ